MKTLLSISVLLLASYHLRGQFTRSVNRRANIAQILVQGSVNNNVQPLQHKDSLKFSFTFDHNFYKGNRSQAISTLIHFGKFLDDFIGELDTVTYALSVKFYEKDDSSHLKKLNSSWSGPVGPTPRIGLSRPEEDFLKILPFHNPKRFYGNGCYCLILQDTSYTPSQNLDSRYFGVVAAVVHYWLLKAKRCVKIYHIKKFKTEVLAFNSEYEFQKSLSNIPEFDN